MKVNGTPTPVTPKSPANIKGGTQISQDANGAYTISLNNKDNKVDISQQKDGSWQISIDGKAKLTLSEKEMENLTLKGNGGNDVVNVISGNLKKQLTFDGGVGSDTLKLGFDPKANTVVDKSKVKFEPGKRVGADKDTFEYHTKGKVTAGEGKPLPSRTFTKTTEVHD